MKKLQRKQHIDLKEVVLLAFIDLVYEKGIENVTLQKVADKARVAFGTVRYHYANDQQGLTDSAVIYVYEAGYKFIEDYSIEARKQASFNPIKNYIDTMFAWIEVHPSKASLMMYYWFLCTGKNRTKLINAEYINIAVQRIVSQIHETVGMKIYNQVKNIEHKASQIHAAVMGAGIVAMTTRDYDMKKQMCLAMVEAIMSSE